MMETADSLRVEGHLFFDGTCTMCRRWAERVRGILARGGVKVVLFDSGADEEEMRLNWNDGREYGGVDALILLCGRVWWAWPFFGLTHVPGVGWLLRNAYRWIAKNRHCIGGSCAIGNSGGGRTASHSARLGWFLLIGLVSYSVIAGEGLAGWVWMWMIAGSLWIGFKVLAAESAGGIQGMGRRAVAYFAWVGMSASVFVSPRNRWVGGSSVGRAGGMCMGCLGAALIWGVTRFVGNTVLAGWIGMVGLLFLLHFGLFEVIAGVFRRTGFAVRSIMENPWKSNSLAEFWGSRWNRGFSDIACIAILRPFARRYGAVIGTMAVYSFSGIVHELVVSVPARGGYGMPTAYFLVQGAGVLVERQWMRHLGSPIGKRIFLWMMVLTPAYWLFHPPFMRRVFYPFLIAIGAI